MDPEKKALWIAALRSGEYKQARGHLQTKDVGHCCLGVACEIAIQDGLSIQVDTRFAAVRYDSESGFLPPSAMEWLGLATHNGCFSIPTTALDGHTQFSLSELNDEGFTFDQIADLIERFF